MPDTQDTQVERISQLDIGDGKLYEFAGANNGVVFDTIEDAQAAIQAGTVQNGDVFYIKQVSSDPLDIHAATVEYDNSNSGLESDNVQDAIDELNSDLDDKQDKLTNPLTRSNIVNNLTSTSATDVLSAAQGRVLYTRENSRTVLKNVGPVAGGTTSNQTVSTNKFSDFRNLLFILYTGSVYLDTKMMDKNLFTAGNTVRVFWYDNHNLYYADFSYLSDTTFQIKAVWPSTAALGLAIIGFN